jgi:23S rRNA-/tRNA-specific pseudouridylate synthase
MKRKPKGRLAQGREKSTREIKQTRLTHTIHVAGKAAPLNRSTLGRVIPNPQATNRLDILTGGVLIAVAEHPHLERALPEALRMIDRSRLAVRNVR